MPAAPVLPGVAAEQLETVDDEVYWALETRERRLTDWALEMQSMLRVLCSPNNEGR